MSQTGKLTPNLDHQSTKLLNLIVLQRTDPFIEEILFTAAHVTLYDFHIESNQWSRKDVEGSLFVVKRNAQPRFQFIVMNRRSTDNLVENLLGDFEYEVQLPYLLYRNAVQDVNGIWFYNPHECAEVGDLFSRIITAYSKAPPNAKLSASKREFVELEVGPSMSLIADPPGPSSTVSTIVESPQDLSFLSTSNVASNIGINASNVATSRQPNHYSSPVPFSTYAPSFMPTPSPTPQVSFHPLPTAFGTNLHEMPDPGNGINRITNLVKPSSFLTPPLSSSMMVPSIFSSVPTAAAVHPSLNLLRPHGTPLLQPFPPPTPPPSLTPNSNLTSVDGPLISRDKVRDALLTLLQDDQLIDMFYQALLKVQKS